MRYNLSQYRNTKVIFSLSYLSRNQPTWIYLNPYAFPNEPNLSQRDSQSRSFSALAHRNKERIRDAHLRAVQSSRAALARIAPFLRTRLFLFQLRRPRGAFVRRVAAPFRAAPPH